MSDLEKRIQELEDIEAIKRLKSRYAMACDDMYNPDKLEKMFVEDAVWDGGLFGRYEGRQAIREFFAGVSKDLSFAVHYPIGPDISVDGNNAKAKWYLWQTATFNKTQAFFMAAIYEDKYVKVNGEWFFKEVIANILFQTPYEKGWAKQPSMD